MKILNLIVARSDSKRLKNKNMRLIDGKPLIDYTIDFSKKIASDNLILLSTDSEKILERGKKKKILCPWLRPKYLSNDRSNLVDVSIHAIKWYEKKIGSVDALILLQSSSPFRDLKTVNRGIRIFKKNINNTIISISANNKHPKWNFIIKNNLLHPYYKSIKFDYKDQLSSIEKTYRPNGNFYIISKKKLFKEKSFYRGNLKPIILHNIRDSIDIDTLHDLDYAKFLYSK